MAQPRRFPPPWSVEELDACFVVIDSAGGGVGKFPEKAPKRDRCHGLLALFWQSQHASRHHGPTAPPPWL
jgi:hypothetical protein